MRKSSQLTPVTAFSPARFDHPYTSAWRPMNVRALLVGLAGVGVGLVLLSYAVPRIGSGPLFSEWDGAIGLFFNVDAESNLPAWWSSLVLGSAAILYAGAGWLARRRGAGLVLPWVVIGAILAAMSIDESAQVHENLGTLVGSVPVGLHFTWLVIGAPLAVGLIVAVGLLGMRLPHRVRIAALVGFGVFFAGAVGLEFVGGYVDDHALEGPAGLNVYAVSVHLEELLELIGGSILLVSPLRAVLLRKQDGVGVGVDVEVGPVARLEKGSDVDGPEVHAGSEADPVLLA